LGYGGGRREVSAKASGGVCGDDLTQEWRSGPQLEARMDEHGRVVFDLKSFDIYHPQFDRRRG
jgi:hypothetical protein